jgi:hypothetical protein
VDLDQDPPLGDGPSSPPPEIDQQTEPPLEESGPGSGPPPGADEALAPRSWSIDLLFQRREEVSYPSTRF